MNIDNLKIKKDLNVRDAIKKLDDGAKGIVFVVSENDELIGTITDGDFRRWILKNGSMDENVCKIMNQKPIYLMEGEASKAQDLMLENSIRSVPILNLKKNIIDIKFISGNTIVSSRNEALKETSIVIMAGGLGTRLYPYTKILPKPLIPIGDTPIIERIMDKFNNYGGRDFYLTVNYKKNMIKSYFNEINKEYTVKYVEEDKPLGTGGSLSLLKGKIDKTFFVSNCDILIDADYESILNYHKNRGNKITVITSVKNFQIPYGVFKLNDNGNISGIEEKPEYTFLINTGMYVIEPEVLNDIPNNEFYNLPDIVERYMNDGIDIGVYPISEQSWMDMGQLNEMKDMVDKIEEKEKNNY